MIDNLILDTLQSARVDCVLSLPCNMLSGLMRAMSGRQLLHVPVCREEEGVGIAAGLALAGNRPLLLMQNSGLGNLINALMSLTRLYRLPLFMLMSHRGGPEEQIIAQVPMGQAAPLLLQALEIDFCQVDSADQLRSLGPFINQTYQDGIIRAAFLMRGLWHAAQ